jgi:hypothetical protein
VALSSLSHLVDNPEVVNASRRHLLQQPEKDPEMIQEKEEPENEAYSSPLNESFVGTNEGI